MKGITIISFDGLNRSGKGTQLKLLKKYIENISISVQVIRGDGSREGKGNTNYYDPENDWWENWQNIPYKTPENWDEAYRILCKENADELKKFEINHDTGFILMDRCYISRWFVERQRDINVPFEEIMKNNHIFPQKYFILDAPKNVLLERHSDDNPAKSQFRKEIVEKWYDLWQDTIQEVEKILVGKIVRIDSTETIDTIHKKVLNNLDI